MTKITKMATRKPIEVKVINTKTGLVKFVGEKTANSALAMKNANLMRFEDYMSDEKPRPVERVVEEKKIAEKPQESEKIESENSELETLRAEYEKKFGKAPNWNMKPETIKKRLNQ